jgi:hypothetical protein
VATLKVPIAKAGATIDIEKTIIDNLPEEMFELIVMEGLKAILNSRMSKVGAVTKLEGDAKAAAQAKAMEIAADNLDKLQKGEIKTKSAAKVEKSSREVMTEARRLAKAIVKDEIRAAGMSPSKVEASVITKAANALLEARPEIIEQAKANIAARTGMLPKAADDADAKAKAIALLESLGGIAESPKLKAKAEREKAERKATLSAIQAGKPAPRKKAPQPSAH